MLAKTEEEGLEFTTPSQRARSRVMEKAIVEREGDRRKNSLNLNGRGCGQIEEGENDEIIKRREELARSG